MSMTEPIRIAILTEAGPCEGRANLTLSVLQATADEVRRSADVEIYLVGEDQMGIEGLGCEQSQRGARWNAAIRALRETDAEAILILEADTLIDGAFLELYVEHLRMGYGGLSVFDHYVLDTESERCVFWDGYVGRLRNTPLANGRCLSRAWLDEVDWHLWKGESDDLTQDMVDKWTELIVQASHAGESRNFGCIATQIGMVTFRDKGLAFFEQAGDSANTRPLDRAEFLGRHYSDMAEIILSGEVPDLSFDEPSYSIVDDDEHIADDHPAAIGEVPSLDETSSGEITSAAGPSSSEEPEPAAPTMSDSTTTANLAPAPSAVESSLETIDSPPGNAPRITLKRRAIEGIEPTEPTATGVTLTRRAVADSPANSESTQQTPDPVENTIQAPTSDAQAETLPETPDGWVLRGEALFADGHLDEAERCFVQALMLNPIYSRALNDLAVVQHQRGHIEQAEHLYLKAATFDPNQADAFVGLIGLSAGRGQTSLALRYAARGLKRAPDHPQLLEVVTTLTQEANQAIAQEQGA